ncbi:helix-turn-helix domain-containing protein [Streptomyces sp. NP-1717]|uniref:helix-turn-helix domain-containing protein n=1 Tax=Streptomyces sp. NP-1717 TaxID=2704470 RepID=UPI001F5D769F|nr:helix-turn-helix transcriptional regulator [Streptomyces sp. NP-1717]MCI3221997.1 helix-turn-helix transcriptional regulator [Streptomyces sp. NP-1717]
MAENPKVLVGARIRHYRRKNGNRSMAAVAGLCGVTERYFSMIENGKRSPSSGVLTRIAAELQVPVSALLGDEPPAKAPVTLTTAPDVAGALLGYRSTRAVGPPVGPVPLRERVEEAWRTWQKSDQRFTEIEEALPALIADVEHSVRAYRSSSDESARRDVLRVAADFYGLMRSYCRRSGRLDLSLMVADRARRAAEDADDPIRIAAAHWNLGHCLLSQDGGAQEADEVAGVAIGELHSVPESTEKAAIQGALELVRVVAEAQQRQWWDARQRLVNKAEPLGKKAGESNTMWTVFGPTNIGLHALTIEMLAGHSAEGLRLADDVNISQLPSRERQFTFTLELARCYDQRRDDPAVLVHLLDLEKLSAEDMARSTVATDMVTGLLHRVRPTFQPQVAKLAERLGIAP